jgi:DNA/RNA endonuclease G (NUC1)
MKKLMLYVNIAILVALLVGINSSYAQEGQVNWEAFSKNLVMALGTTNTGLQLSAMGMIIRHGDNLQVNDAVFDVMRIYRLNKDPQVRILALVTLHKIKNDWSMYCLKSNMKFETDERIKQMCSFILNDYYTQKDRVKHQTDQPLLSDAQK